MAKERADYVYVHAQVRHATTHYTVLASSSIRLTSKDCQKIVPAYYFLLIFFKLQTQWQ